MHRYLGNKPVTDIEETREIIANVQQQYRDYGMGRWAVLLKDTREFIGWCGLKHERNINGHETYVDLGYRFRREFWGQGYGYESAKAFIDYGFGILHLPKICASFEYGNTASEAIMKKCGMHYVNDFFEDGVRCGWYEIDNLDDIKK